jgi:hypothetical protein
VVSTTAANDIYTNTATVEGVYEPDGTLTDTDTAIVAIADPAVAIEKRLVGLDRDIVAPNYVTFTIVITNVGPSTIDVLPLADEYDTTFLEFVTATPYPQQDPNDGLVTWTDLTGPVPYVFNRNLPPGDAFSITTVFRIVRDLYATTNVATVSGATDVFGNPADEVQDDEIVRNAPTPIELLYFRAVAEKKAVRLEWATLVELDRVGFTVYRASDANFDNAQAIAYYDAIGGGSYSHLDHDVTSGQVYWYWLVKVGIDGPEEPHGPVWSGIHIDQPPTRVYLPLVQKGFVQDTVHAR